jgi:hypothetical protein
MVLFTAADHRALAICGVAGSLNTLHPKMHSTGRNSRMYVSLMVVTKRVKLVPVEGRSESRDFRRFEPLFLP